MATQLYTKNIGIRSNTNLPVYPITDFESVKNKNGETLEEVINDLKKLVLNNSNLKEIEKLKKEITELKKQIKELNK